MKVINYTTAYKKKLRNFIRNHFSKQLDVYLDYRLEQITESDEDISYNIIVLDDNEDVIGCNLFFPTKAKINGVEQKVYWSHNTLIDLAYRGDAGIMLILELMKRKHFGYGLSKASVKFSKSFKSNFLSKASVYYMFNKWVFKEIMQRLFNKKNNKKFLFPQSVVANKLNFKKVSSTDELKIPNKGYWWKDSVDIDFIRDEFFLTQRFFNNFNTYYVYKLEQQNNTDKDECYFVVRPILWRKFIVLSVVDFRFNVENKKQISIVLKAINKIATINRIGLVTIKTNFILPALITTSKMNINLSNPFFISRNSLFDIVCSKEYSFLETPSVVVTSADSDNDFTKQSPI